MSNPSLQTAIAHRQTGFSLVELMVSMVLGLVIIGGVMSVFMSSKSIFAATESLARIQENGRVALTLLSRDILEAGQQPCGDVPIANVIRSEGSIPRWADWGAGVVQGIDKSVDVTDLAAFGTDKNNRIMGTDAILIFKGSDEVQTITSHDPASTTLTLNSIGNLKEKDVILVCDKQSGVIVQINRVNENAKTLDYRKSDANRNCGNGLGYPAAETCDTAKTFDAATAQLTKLESTVWYVGRGLEGKTNSIFKTYIRKSNNGVISVSREEVITDVKSFDITYLTNTNEGVLNADWLSANDEKFAATSHGWSEQNTGAQVVAVRVELTLLGTDKAVAGTPALERKLVQVIRLRNRNNTFQASDDSQ
ncbi:MAG: prepilin-type N-terminal cleavage/methylation domain-containing protein [Rhodoferax sp.]|nr:prepilin-type N-terminal cleavage/methylation domain-containing protein [Rhodoferax sp.]